VAIIADLRGMASRSLARGIAAGGRVRAGSRCSRADHEQLAADVLALLDHLKINEAVFAGCSIGGSVLLELWRIAPERMTGLALSAQAAGGWRDESQETCREYRECALQRNRPAV